jgi:cytochrome c biogenesis protein CcmG/thiol:disulfide interchange protein DsbE
MKGLTVGRWWPVFAMSVVLCAQQHAVAQTPEQYAAAIAKGHTLFYRTLNTYTEEATLTYTFRGKVQGMDLSRRNHSSILRCAFVRGKGFALESSDTALFVSADSLTLYRPLQSQYQVRKIKSEPTLDDFLQAVDPVFRKIRWYPPLIGIFAKGDSPQSLVPEITRWESVARETLGTREVWHVRARAGAGHGNEALPLQMWFDAATCQLVKAEADLAPMLKATSGDPVEATITFTVETSTRNQPVDESRLCFRPAESDRRVEHFDFADATPIGSRIPNVAGTTFKGDKLSLESLRGKVVLLDFWTTWCAPCLAHLPHVEKLGAEFGDDLVVVGVNADNSDESSRVQEVLAAKKIHFTQLADSQGIWRKVFRVGGFPSYVLIDRQGIVRDIFPAHSPLSDLRMRIQEQVAAGK